MAAQERAKQQQPVQSTPPPVFDFLDSSPAPPPPPAFDSSLLPPPPAPTQQYQQQYASPPAFDASVLPPPNVDDSKPPPPMMMTMMEFDPMRAAPPSAPAFEDLMDTMNVMPAAVPMMPPPVMPMQPPPTSSTTVELDDEALQAILGIEGLTQAEKQEMIDEQVKIMKSIQDSKQSIQTSAADAFEARSFSAAVGSIGSTTNSTTTSTTTAGGMQLHGQERTRAAIKEGTALKVQCPACENWMQVTGTAQLMFCPVCQTVSPVQGSGLTPQEAEQMAADARLAEQLQKEEYESAERETLQRQQQQRGKKKTSATPPAASATPQPAQGWMEWLGFGTPVAPPAAASTSSQREIRTTRSTDSTEGLLSGGNVAKTSPHMFACVTDSIGAAVNYATALPQDEEGNVHGVDASSLLAVTQVGRNTNPESEHRYERQQD